MKPVVYLASPYTIGDVALNVRFQCEVFDRLLRDGRVLPVAPLWSHFQHLLFPRPYEEWIAYSLEMLSRYDACLHLAAKHEEMGYAQPESQGAEREVEAFRRLGKPIFPSVQLLYEWEAARQ